jgi:NAD(P)-dependent dehydrogenase (short-subunit alcohol dehydrogenase family)
MNQDFVGKVVSVAGGSRGMGLTCVERFLAGGAWVLPLANDAASLEDLVAAMPGPPPLCHEGDVRWLVELEAARDPALSQFGGLGALDGGRWVQPRLPQPFALPRPECQYARDGSNARCL